MSRTTVVEPGTATGNRWSVVIAVGLIVFMATLDTSVVTVALPRMQADLGVGTELGQWMLLGYLLPLIALTLPAGRWVDRVGPRAAQVGSVAGFAVASLAVGLSRVPAVLLLARAVQGAFAGVLFALLTVVVSAAVRPEFRGRAMAVATTVGPLGSVSGPVIGGLITDGPGWPWIFWLNVPIAAVILLVVLIRMPAGGRLLPPGRGTGADIGLLGSATAIGLAALTLSTRQPGWFAAVALAIVPVLIWCRTVSGRQVLAAIVGVRLRAALAALCGSSLATAGLMFLLPYFLQRDLGLSPSATGIALLAFPVGTVLSGPIGGVLADRIGAGRLAVAGAVVLLAGLLILLPIDAAWRPVDLAWRLLVAGIGMGIFYGPNLAVVMAEAPVGSLGVVGAVTSLVRQLGFAVGPASVTVAWAAGGSGPVGIRAGLGVIALAGVAVVLVLLPVLGNHPADAPAHRPMKTN